MADAYRQSERKRTSGLKSVPGEQIKELAVTIDPVMGGIVKVQKISKAGKHEELSDEECARLVGEDELDEVQDAIAEAFDVAVMSVIGDRDQAETEDDDEEDKAVRRFLINDLLIPRAVRKRILHRLLLGRMLRRQMPNGQQRQENRNVHQESTGPRPIPFHRASKNAKRK